MDLSLLLIAAAAGAPTLVEHAAPQLAKVGISVPVYLTGGQRAAIAALDAASSVVPAADAAGGDTTHTQVFSRYLEARNALIAARGTLPDGHTPAATAADYQALANALLAAAKAGYDAADEPYQVSDDWNASGKTEQTASEGFGGGMYADLVPLVRKTVWDDLSSASSLNALGAAVRAVRGQASVSAGVWGDSLEAEDMAAAFGDLSTLALEMDGQGYRVQGPPFSYSVTDGVKAAGSFWEEAAKNGLSSALGLLGDALEKLAFSTPGLVVLGAGAWFLWRKSA